MQAVVFDIGRVLVHWAPQVIEDALCQICTASPSQIRAARQAVHHEFSIGALGAAEYHRYLIRTIGITPVWDLFYEVYCRGLCRDEEGLSYATALKRRGLAIGVISNTNAVHVQWLRDHLAEFAQFDSVIVSSDVGLEKPDPAIYRLSLHRLRALPDQVLFLDDLVENVAGAQAVGMAGVLHTDWDSSRRAVETWLADSEIRSHLVQSNDL